MFGGKPSFFGYIVAEFASFNGRRQSCSSFLGDATWLLWGLLEAKTVPPLAVLSLMALGSGASWGRREAMGVLRTLGSIRSLTHGVSVLGPELTTG